MNDAIYFSLAIPTFMSILIITVFSSGGNVALDTFLRSCRKMSNLAVGGIMVYAGTSINERTDFQIIRNGVLTGCRNRDEILRLVLILKPQQMDIISVNG